MNMRITDKMYVVPQGNNRDMVVLLNDIEKIIEYSVTNNFGYDRGDIYENGQPLDKQIRLASGKIIWSVDEANLYNHLEKMNHQKVFCIATERDLRLPLYFLVNVEHAKLK